MDELNYDDLGPEEKAEWDKAQKKHQRRMLSMMLVSLLLVLPTGFAGYKMWSYYHQIGATQDWAEAEIKKPQPNPVAYGDLGAIYLDQGRITEALPWISKAMDLETQRGDSAQDHLTFAKAQLAGLKQGLPGCSKELALKALQEACVLADKMPQGRKAATYHGAGMFYLEAGERPLAIACLSKASDLQRDDWVDEGGGKRYKVLEISGAYAKDIASALQMRQ